MKKKVILFLQSGVGGAERVTVTIGKNLDRNKFDVLFCLIGKNKRCLCIDQFIPSDFPVIRLPCSKGLKALYQFCKIIKNQKPDVVFSSIMHANTKLLACSMFFRKIKFVIRNNNYLYTLSKLQLILLSFFYRFSDYIIAQTDEMATELINGLNLPPEKVFVLQNPIDKSDIDEKKNAPTPFAGAEKIIYVASGRCQPVKGYDILIKAFNIVLMYQPNAELHILGKITDNCENYYRSLLELLQDYNISQHVFFEGFQNNPYMFVKNAHCFVLSSRNEGLPNVLIESLYLGTPVAATKCIPVISRIVCEGVNGFLAETENCESLANAMLKASVLGRISSYYQSAGIDEFQRLLE